MNIPLCIDLDGTLIKSDLLFETFLLLIKKNPLYIFACLYWLIKGKANLKDQIISRVTINPSFLPYSENFLRFLQSEKEKGRSLSLVTASNQRIANQIADHLKIFSEVIGSDKIRNLKGKEKSLYLIKKYGKNRYDYAGNSKQDILVWKSARRAIVVNATKRVASLSNKVAFVEALFSERNNTIKQLLKLFRVHQWVKNLLLFIPLFVGHLYLNKIAILNSILAFVIFCSLASSVYILNDLLDLYDDRQHKTKRYRPIAAGNISIQTGVVLAPLLFILAFGFSLLLSKIFFATLLTYYILTIFYSFYLKKKMLIDIFTLAIFYTLRIIAGIATVGGDYSPWLITFSIFLFLSLAFAKRFSELENLRLNNKSRTLGRGYLVGDLPQLQLFGTISGYISVLVLALYIHSSEVLILYRHSGFLWLICLILLYWISRIWMLAARNLLNEDPVLFALKDRLSWMLITMVAVIMIGAI